MATTLDYPEIMRLFDKTENMNGKLTSDTRKRLFRALESTDDKSWEDARSILITPSVTLWQAVVNIGVHPDQRPTATQLMIALEREVA